MDQSLALTMRAFGILFLHGRDNRHGAMATLTTQPTKEAALQHRRIEPIRFSSPMFAGYGHAGGVDDMRIYAAFPQPASQRASQKLSRPVSYATAIRVIGLPALIASSRQPCSSFSRSSGFGSNFFSGSRLTPGISPATSQFDRLSSMTAISVLSCMKAAGLALLLSWGFCIRSSVTCKLIEATILQLSRP